MTLISEAKRAANRANAARSTGPRSAVGKAAARFNAVRHGMCAEHAVLPGEHEASFEALKSDLLERLAPEGEAQCQAVELAVRELWRLRRAGLSETGALRQLANPYLLQAENVPPAEREVYVLGATLAQDFSETGIVEKLSRYETRSGRGLERALRLLERLRALAASTGQARPAARIGFVPSPPSPPPAPRMEPCATPEDTPSEAPKNPRFPAEFGFVPQNRAALIGSVSPLAVLAAEAGRAPRIRWPVGLP